MARVGSARPFPPLDLIDGATERFDVADDLKRWIVDTFIAGGAPLENPEHEHLRDATLGVLWTNVANGRAMRTVIGQAELMPPMAMGKWQRARAVQQVEEWFGVMPDFLLTFYAPAACDMDDATFCALVEHELYHCGQAKDIFGGPKFTRDGRPCFALRGHDVEEFVGVVARYGAGAAGVQPMVDAALARPSVAAASIAGACGTCMRAAA